MSTEYTFILLPDTKEQAQALIAFLKALIFKFEKTYDEKYKQDFVAKIKQGETDLKVGKGISMSLEELENLSR